MTLFKEKSISSWLNFTMPKGGATVACGKALSRRHFLAASASAPIMAGAMKAQAQSLHTQSSHHGADQGQLDWLNFKERFILPEGRVVDTANGGVSHSEGQGIGMLSAVHFNDQEMFDRLAGWTNQHLVRGTDHLYSWRYKPDQANPVDDPNNATDGDMLIAWAMFEAARKWNSPIYRNVAYAIVEDIRQALVRPMGNKLVLLPGTYGFVKDEGATLNPSYYMFPAIYRFAAETQHPTWTQLFKDGVSFMRETRYGQWGLPSDWVSLGQDGKPTMASGWPPRFSWDAVRVPLYMSWVGLHQEPVVTGAVAFWDSYSHGTIPAWANLETGGVAPYGQNCGLKAIRDFTTAMHQGKDSMPTPSAAGAQDYYAAALTLLVHIAYATRDGYAASIV